tara:strand:+ start:7093 stop:8049 length:957 start_codon:yes stop_codon:yes gene_type:complete
MQTDEQEEEVIVGDEQEEDIVVEVDDDEPDRSTKRHGAESEDDVTAGEDASDGADETAEYGKKVEKRIARLTARMRDAERDRDDLKAQNTQLAQEKAQTTQRLTSVDSGYLKEFGSRVETQLESARLDYKDAIMRNDPDRILAAQEKLNTAQQEQGQHQRAVRVAEARQRQQPQPRQQPPEQRQPQQRQAPQPDEKAESWAKDNSWFGTDKTRTFATYGIHQDLVDEGFDARGDEYYDELNKRLRTEFPHKFEQSQEQDDQQRGSAHQTVAGGRRGSSGGASQKQGRGSKRQIKLTPGQAAAAREIGVSYEEYAKYIT